MYDVREKWRKSMNSLFLEKYDSFIRYFVLPGEGDHLIYLPGLSIPSTANFLSLATHSRMTNYHSILVDYLGSGFSDHPKDFDYSIKNHAETVADILDHENIKGSTIIGHSMGGTVGIMLALIRPELVANLIVGEGNIDPGGGSGSSYIASFSKNEYVTIVHDEILARFRSDAVKGDSKAAYFCGALGCADPAGVHGNSVALVELEPEFKNQFFQLPIPRTFVYGKTSLPKNKVYKADVPNPKELEQHGIQTAVLKNAGHGLMNDNLEGFVDILLKALKI